MHHSDDLLPMTPGLLEKLGLGATGKFPEGKLVEHDEGEIQFSVRTFEGKVIIEWGKSVKWIGMNATQALELAACLIRHAASTFLISGDPAERPR